MLVGGTNHNCHTISLYSCVSRPADEHEPKTRSIWPSITGFIVHHRNCLYSWAAAELQSIACLFVNNWYLCIILTSQQQVSLSSSSSSLVLLRIPNPQPNPRILSESAWVRIREFFAAVSDGFGSFVRESMFTCQVAPFKRRYVTVCGRQCGRVED